MRAVQNLELELDRGEAVAELGRLAGERLLVEFVGEAEVEQPVLLGDQECVLTLELGTLGPRFCLMVPGLRGQDGPEPIPDIFILDAHAGEDRHHVALDLGLGHADAGMPFSQVPRAAVVDVDLVARWGALDDAFSGDGSSAVAAAHELAGVGEIEGVVDVASQERLHAVPGGAVNEGLVLAGVELTLVGHFAEIAAVTEHGVDRGAGEAGCAGPVDGSFLCEPLGQRIDGQVLVGVEVEHSADIGGGHRVEVDRAATVHPHVAVAVGSAADEPAVLDAAGEALADIDGELLGVEAGHVGEGAPHHPPGGVAVGGLGNGDEGQTVLGFEPFELDIVKEVAGGTVHLVEEQAVEFVGVLFGVGDELAEGRALVRLAGRLGDAEEADDGAAGGGGVACEGFFLDGQGKPFALLFTAGDAGQGDELLGHGVYPLRRVGPEGGSPS